MVIPAGRHSRRKFAACSTHEIVVGGSLDYRDSILVATADQAMLWLLSYWPDLATTSRSAA